MPIALNDVEQHIELSGACSVEEAELLKDWMLAHPDWAVDAGQCEYMHTAVIQVLIAAQPKWFAWPKPPHLCKALQSIFSAEAVAQRNTCHP